MFKYTQKGFNHSFSLKEILSRIETKTALKSGVAASLAFVAGISVNHLFSHPNQLISGLWCTMTAIVVLQAHLGGTYKAGLNRLLGVLLGTIMGGICTSFLGSDPVSLGIAIVFTVLGCSLLNLKDSIRIACLSTAVVMILWGMNPTISPWTFSFYRFIDSCLGILIAVIIAHTFWPSHATVKMRSNVIQTLSALNQLYLFSISAEPLGEKKLIQDIQQHLIQNRVFLDELEMELLMKSSKIEDWSFLLHYLESIFESIITLSEIDKEHFHAMLDHELTDQLKETTDNIDLYFQELVKLLEGSQEKEPIVDLKQTLEKLQKELIRFRETKATRQFSLKDVESFFVCFFNLKNLALFVLELEQHIRDLNAHET